MTESDITKERALKTIDEIIDIAICVFGGDEIYWGPATEFRELDRYDDLQNAIELIETLGLDLSKRKEELKREKEENIRDLLSYENRNPNPNPPGYPCLGQRVPVRELWNEYEQDDEEEQDTEY